MVSLIIGLIQEKIIKRISFSSNLVPQFTATLYSCFWCLVLSLLLCWWWCNNYILNYYNSLFLVSAIFMKEIIILTLPPPGVCCLAACINIKNQHQRTCFRTKCSLFHFPSLITPCNEIRNSEDGFNLGLI